MVRGAGAWLQGCCRGGPLQLVLTWPLLRPGQHHLSWIVMPLMLLLLLLGLLLPPACAAQVIHHDNSTKLQEVPVPDLSPVFPRPSPSNTLSPGISAPLPMLKSTPSTHGGYYANEIQKHSAPRIPDTGYREGQYDSHDTTSLSAKIPDDMVMTGQTNEIINHRILGDLCEGCGKERKRKKRELFVGEELGVRQILRVTSGGGIEKVKVKDKDGVVDEEKRDLLPYPEDGQQHHHHRPWWRRGHLGRPGHRGHKHRHNKRKDKHHKDDLDYTVDFDADDPGKGMGKYIRPNYVNTWDDHISGLTAPASLSEALEANQRALELTHRSSVNPSSMFGGPHLALPTSTPLKNSDVGKVTHRENIAQTLDDAKSLPQSWADSLIFDELAYPRKSSGLQQEASTQEFLSQLGPHKDQLYLAKVSPGEAAAIIQDSNKPTPSVLHPGHNFNSREEKEE
ncbi:unnamed protein product, partial [Meganyctiphanes norvegica]